MIEIHDARVEHIDAGALLLPVDGQLCKLGGATASALRAALDPSERADGVLFSAQDCARMLRAALPEALAAAAAAGLGSLAATVIGTHYRMPVDLAVRAFIDGVAAAKSPVVVQWSIPDAEARTRALDAARKLGLVR